ncbi:ATP-binding protein [Paenibacillus alvei]|uniref:ATP-binding protein n=1 Tax=Paenibacillus alvei TaxID=44250 RepID=A0ABT4H8F3_PAEAL|nr:ATP-binding protein [Paenibacillus alvei]EJW14351.1 hypothetical protein PAV_14c00440 [Paenibacillus alvei DSM 29]MCY9542836.1 ATP-binding protein [Paenibacillus alvei]MCY9736109.1 ATP-binding protein [Paenibacillus alvei]MCY9757344.1 ATP-binding protein [Paenibacillus alvei]MCY9764916.1 ATP-binding protein [Paenibacillus alvei]
MIQFPIAYFEQQFVYNRDKECWSYYELPGFNIEFLSDDDLMVEFRRLESFFWQINADMHLLILPDYQTSADIYRAYRATLSGPAVEAAKLHVDETSKVLSERYGDEETNYKFYIGVKLPNADIKQTDIWKELDTYVKDFVRYLTQMFFDIAGIEPAEIFEDVIDRYKRSEKLVFNKVSGRLRAKPITTDTTQWLIRRNFYRGIGQAPLWESWEPEYTTDDTQTIRIPMQYDTLRLTEGVVDDSPERFVILSQAGSDNQGHVAFLCMSHVPYDMYFPNVKWLYDIQQLDFPVEVSVRISIMENRKALKEARNKKKELKDQDRHAQETDNDTSYNVLEGRYESSEIEATLDKSKMPLLLTSIVFCIAAPSEDELKKRVSSLKDLYQDMGIFLEQPLGDQLLLFNEFLPGAKRYVQDYVQIMEPATVAGSMFGATEQIGDQEGFYFATTGTRNQPVYMKGGKAARATSGTKTNSLAMAFSGSTGKGKSQSANTLLYNLVMSGGKALVIDPKKERGHWKEQLFGLKDHINVINISSDNVDDHGVLDPYNIFKKRKEAETVALNILSYFTGIQVNDKRFSKLNKAVKQATSMNNVIECLLNSGDPVSIEIGEHIEGFKDVSFTSLLFGEANNHRSFDFDSVLTILQVDGLELPDEDTEPEHYTLNEMLSVGMMMPISSIALEFIKQHRDILKIVLLDEAWSFLNTPQGKALSTRMVRMGRSMFALIMFVSQNAVDYNSEKLKNNIGMKFAFGVTDSDEVTNVLKFLGMRDNENNRAILTDLENGECIMKDIYGRIGKVKFDAVFKDLIDCFDTRPPEKKAG